MPKHGHHIELLVVLTLVHLFALSPPLVPLAELVPCYSLVSLCPKQLTTGHPTSQLPLASGFQLVVPKGDWETGRQRDGASILPTLPCTATVGLAVATFLCGHSPVVLPLPWPQLSPAASPFPCPSRSMVMAFGHCWPLGCFTFFHSFPSPCPPYQ